MISAFNFIRVKQNSALTESALTEVYCTFLFNPLRRPKRVTSSRSQFSRHRTWLTEPVSGAVVTVLNVCNSALNLVGLVLKTRSPRLDCQM